MIRLDTIYCIGNLQKKLKLIKQNGKNFKTFTNQTLEDTLGTVFQGYQKS